VEDGTMKMAARMEALTRRRVWAHWRLVALGLALATTTACSQSEAQSSADAIFKGRFVTLDPALPEAQALAVTAGRITAIGSEAHVERSAGSNTRRVDVPGVALPGLADGHVHIAALGEQLEMLNLRGLSKNEILSQVADLAAKTPIGEWIHGRGWDQGFWKPAVFPNAAELDAIAPRHPVVLTRIDGHSVWVNSVALEAAGITRDTKDPEGGLIMRDDAGRPTGLLVDRATYAVTRAIPPPTRQQRERQIRAALAQYTEWGLTSVHDAGADLETIRIFKDLLASGDVPIRLYVMARGSGETADHYLARGPEIGLGEGRLTIRSFKIMLDGALGSRGAQLAQPYSDAPAERGLELLADGPLDTITRDAAARGFQVNAHAIGDLAIRRALDAFERAGIKPEHRFRIEHVSVLAPADLPRFARLGVIASMQPNFVGEYSRWAEERVGPDRIGWVYTTRSLLDSGAIMVSGSDYPAADSGSPLTTLYSLVTRKGARREPADGWFPNQRVDVATALRLMTAAPAFGAFQEEDLGTLSEGRYADFTVLSDDPRTHPADALQDLSVRMTVVGGTVVFETARSSEADRQ
jgi:predicted amidohydrolase YtcJ